MFWGPSLLKQISFYPPQLCSFFCWTHFFLGVFHPCDHDVYDDALQDYHPLISHVNSYDDGDGEVLEIETLNTLF